MGYFADLDLNFSTFTSDAYLSADVEEESDLEIPNGGRRYPYHLLGSISPSWRSKGLVNHWVECLGCERIHRIQVSRGPMGSFPKEQRCYHRFYCPICGKFNGRYRSDIAEKESIRSFTPDTGIRRFKKASKQWDVRFRQESCRRIFQRYIDTVSFMQHRYKKNPELEGRHILRLLNDLGKAAYGPIEELPAIVSCN